MRLFVFCVCMYVRASEYARVCVSAFAVKRYCFFVSIVAEVSCDFWPGDIAKMTSFNQIRHSAAFNANIVMLNSRGINFGRGWEKSGISPPN